MLRQAVRHGGGRSPDSGEDKHGKNSSGGTDPGVGNSDDDSWGDGEESDTHADGSFMGGLGWSLEGMGLVALEELDRSGVDGDKDVDKGGDDKVEQEDLVVGGVILALPLLMRSGFPTTP